LQQTITLVAIAAGESEIEQIKKDEAIA